jgi:hypothetical protein
MNKHKHVSNILIFKAEKIYRFCFYCICILVLVSSVVRIGADLEKKVGIGELKIRLDHLLHTLAFFVFSLYFLTGSLLELKLFDSFGYNFFFIIIVTTGFIAEIIQIWVPYRSFSLLDMLSNITGIGLGYLITILQPRIHH